ncbi:MAG: redoxin domain-containing protein [Verrucomicrobiales bacterium]
MKLFFSVLLAMVSMVRAATTEPLEIGAPAPEFSLPGVDGKTHTLADYGSAKVLAMLFTCNHCPSAQLYEERVKKIVEDYKHKEVAVVAISPNDPRAVRLDELGYTDLGDTLEDMKIRARDRGYNFPYLYDGDTQAASHAYGPIATPHVFIFDSARRLRYHGRIDDSEREEFVKVHDMRNALDALLAGKDPPVTQTKVVGCSTKWADKTESAKKWLEKVTSQPVALEPVDAAALKSLRENKESGKFRVVNFWATWCGPCVEEFPALLELPRRFGHRDLELVTVAVHFPDEKDEVLKFLTKQQATNRNLILGSTDKAALLDAFDPKWNGALPFTVFISPDGKVLHQQQGAVDPLELRRIIVKALNEKKPWRG